jgi:hypothetical protein
VQGQRDGVADSGRHSGVPVEDQFGVEDVVAELGDTHLLQLAAERVDDVPDELVGHRARQRDALLFHRDRGGLGRPDPHREQPMVPGGLLQQHRSGPTGFHSDGHDPHLAHRIPPLPRALPCEHESRTHRTTLLVPSSP